jgi:dihydroneopterin aldolase
MDARESKAPMPESESATGRIANAQRSIRHVFVRDLAIMAMLGIHEREKLAPQRVIINIDLTVKERGRPLDDNIANVVSYEKVVDHIREIVAHGHVNLVETLGEMIAQRCLENPWVLAVRVRIEKPDIIPEAASVGIEIERMR